MTVEELPVVFSCQSEQLIGFIHKPDHASETGILIVVGGPQYRVGSHRQFVLLARVLADKGIPVMRFDYRGMGDSEGPIRSFSNIDEDIKVAVDTFSNSVPDLTGVVIWGLCDAASAASFYAYQDERIKGLVLLNPWVFTEQGAAKTYLKYYYLQRLSNPELWRKVFTLQFDYRQSFFSIVSLVKNILESKDSQNESAISEEVSLVDSSLALPVRVRECLQRFEYPVLFVLSGKDLTADEFKEVVKSDEKWQHLFETSSVSKVELKESDHTFSSQKWRDEVAQLTLQWLNQLH